MGRSSTTLTFTLFSSLHTSMLFSPMGQLEDGTRPVLSLSIFSTNITDLGEDSGVQGISVPLTVQGGSRGVVFLVVR